MPLAVIEHPGDLVNRFWLDAVGRAAGSAFNEHSGDPCWWTTILWATGVLGGAWDGLFYWCKVETGGIHFRIWILPLSHSRPTLSASSGAGLRHLWSVKSSTSDSDAPAGWSTYSESKRACLPRATLSLKTYFRDTVSKQAVRKATAALGLHEQGLLTQVQS